MDAVYYITGLLTVVVLPAIVIATVVALANPKVLNKSKRINNPVSRGKIVLIGTVALFISVFSFGTVMAATEPASVKQERIAREAAEEKSKQDALATQKKQAQLRAQKEAEKPVVKIESKTESVAFTEEAKEDATLAKGTTKVTQEGVNGERTITYEVTYVEGKETARKETKNEVTTAPVNRVTVTGTYVAPVSSKPKATSNCDPNYSGACVPIASDVDCAGGSGNGPAYVSGPVYVTGSDIYGLDRDGDGVGCE